MALVQETIENVLKNINQDNKGGIFLPYIQRDFVWEKERIYRLLDSLMRRYPIGTILAWETDEPLNYRPFLKNYDEAHDFEEDIVDSAEGIDRRYILDGQQRLQSLYLIRHGSYDGEVLFFDLASDPDSEEKGYVFDFKPDDFKKGSWLNVKAFLDTPYKRDNYIPADLKKKGLIPTHFTDEEQERMGQNAMQLYRTFKELNNISFQTLDGIGLDDIAEIFVRTNSEGVVLEKIDLVMALIRSEWAGARRAFNQLNETVLAMGYKRKAKDFVLQSCLATLGGIPGGGKNEIKQFTTPQIQNALREHFSEVGAAICDVLSFIAGFSFIRSQNVPSFNPVLILICYRYTHGKESWEKARDAAQRFLFASFLSKALNKPTEALMKALIAHVQSNALFDVVQLGEVCQAHHRNLGVDIDVLLDIGMHDPLADLVLHLFYMGHVGYTPDKMTAKDHIFPDAHLKKVRAQGRLVYLKQQRDHILNCEMLTTQENTSKSDQLPEKYFSRCNGEFMALHGIPEPDNDPIWDIRFYNQFLQRRRAIFSVRIAENLQGLVDLQRQGRTKTRRK